MHRLNAIKVHHSPDFLDIFNDNDHCYALGMMNRNTVHRCYTFESS